MQLHLDEIEEHRKIIQARRGALREIMVLGVAGGWVAAII
jgi:hypothetical protein